VDLTDLETKIDEYSKKKSLTKKEKSSFADMLYNSFKQTNDVQAFAHHILQSPIDVTGLMFQKNINKISVDMLDNLARNLIQNNIFLDNKNDIAFTISCNLLSLYIENKNYLEWIFSIFNRALLIIDKGNSFSKKHVNKFHKLILSKNKCRDAFFQVNFNQWSRPEKQRIYKFLKDCEANNFLDLSTKKMQEWTEKYGFESQDRFPIVENAIRKLQQDLKDEESMRLVEIISNNLVKIKDEYNQQCESIKQKDKDIYTKAEEITRIRNNLIKRENEVISLKNEQDRNMATIDSQKKEIDVLTTDLDGFKQMADSTKDEEVFTLKNDIKNALQNEYVKYIEDREAQCSQDLFEAFKARFFKIFATLKRFGITFEEANK